MADEKIATEREALAAVRVYGKNLQHVLEKMRLACGQPRVSNEMRKHGALVSPRSTRGIWLRRDPATLKGAASRCWRHGRHRKVWR